MKKDRHLPAGMYLKHGAYWLVRRNKWHRLGPSDDTATALKSYAQHIELASTSSTDQPKCDLVDMSPLIQLNELLSKAVSVNEAAMISEAGVYFLFDGTHLEYVGMSACVGFRVQKHRPRKNFDRVAFIPEQSEKRRRRLEARYITTYQPRRNVSIGMEFVECYGKKQTLREWSDETGLSVTAITKRIRAGAPVELALTLPAIHGRPIKSAVAAAMRGITSDEQ